MNQEVQDMETQTIPLRKEGYNNIERKENPSENAKKKKVTEIGTQTDNIKENLEKEGKEFVPDEKFLEFIGNLVKILAVASTAVNPSSTSKKISDLVTKHYKVQVETRLRKME